MHKEWGARSLGRSERLGEIAVHVSRWRPRHQLRRRPCQPHHIPASFNMEVARVGRRSISLCCDCLDAQTPKLGVALRQLCAQRHHLCMLRPSHNGLVQGVLLQLQSQVLRVFGGRRRVSSRPLDTVVQSLGMAPRSVASQHHVQQGLSSVGDVGRTVLPAEPGIHTAPGHARAARRGWALHQWRSVLSLRRLQVACLLLHLIVSFSSELDKSAHLLGDGVELVDHFDWRLLQAALGVVLLLDFLLELGLLRLRLRACGYRANRPSRLRRRQRRPYARHRRKTGGS
mmetsp:Transcript_88009/g.247338  ORF Transcript_88009/g.247338 Transcript_88009/m.247338 type:complete len:286 (+) Transcript_88009:737-1594(+)